MSESDWQAGYRKAVLAYVMAHGSMVKKEQQWRSYSSWRDLSPEALDHAAHLRLCGPDPEKSTEVEDSAWQEFDGTFANPPWGEHHGIDATLTCLCGQVQGAPFRLEQSLGELIQGVVTQV